MSRCEGNNIEFKPFYSIFVKDMITMSFNFISAAAEVKDGMIKTRKIDHFHFSFFHFFFKFILGSIDYSGFSVTAAKPRGTRAEARPNLSSFLPLIYVISLFRSPHVAMREEGRPLAVYCGERN